MAEQLRIFLGFSVFVREIRVIRVPNLMNSRQDRKRPMKDSLRPREQAGSSWDSKFTA
jgi:hypothetical protein